jgi:nicotinate-nucleotide pyrophosphorylase (carboxylating)
VKIRPRFREGEKVKKGSKIAALFGPTRALLSGERVALNFLQRLSGIATLTAAFVDAVRGTRAKVLDTRKTTPGLRLLERYAVATGGGVNHRFDLRAMAMAKDNHLAAVGSMRELCRRLQPLGKKMIVVVEAKTLRELEEALEAEAEWVQLDNMGLASLRRAVRINRGRAKLEATGGMTVKRARTVARTGVDFISVGALTHSAPAVDISLEFEV